MTKLDFPDTPSTGEQYGSSGTVWRWDGTRWGSTAGAAGARGQVAYAQGPFSSQSNIGASIVDLGGLSLTFYPVLGRRYKITAACYFVASAVGQTVNMTIFNDGVQLQGATAYLAVVGPPIKAHAEYVFTCTNQVAMPVKLCGQIINGPTSSVALLGGALTPNFLLVEDITYEAGSSGATPTEYAKLAKGYLTAWANGADAANNSTVENQVCWGTYANFVAGRRYQLILRLTMVQTVATDLFWIRGRIDGQQMAWQLSQPNTLTQVITFPSNIYYAATSGSKTVQMTVQRHSGSGLMHVYGTYVASMIELIDMGAD